MSSKVSVMLDPYGNPIVFLREKRTAVQPYPNRAMMFTGYYRPVRRSSQATGVFAQGNAVSGESFFGGMQAPHLKNGPEPIDEPEVSSAEAQAAPAPEDSYHEDGQTQVQQEEGYQPEEQHAQDEVHPQEDVNHQQEEEPHHKQHDAFPPQVLKQLTFYSRAEKGRITMVSKNKIDLKIFQPHCHGKLRLIDRLNDAQKITLIFSVNPGTTGTGTCSSVLHRGNSGDSSGGASSS